MHLSSPITGTRIKAFFAILLIAPVAGAQTHIVSPADLRQAVELKSQQRAQNLKTVNEFLAGPHGEEVLKPAKLSAEQATVAVASLSDPELENLTAKVRQAERQFANNDFAGGHGTEILIIWVLVLASVAVIIYFVVAH